MADFDQELTKKIFKRMFQVDYEYIFGNIAEKYCRNFGKILFIYLFIYFFSVLTQSQRHVLSV